MIAKLTGQIDDLKPTELILDVNGVGYQLHIPFSTFEKIESEKNISLYIYTLHKEDQLKLFGFHNEQEKELFSTLISISGIGPAMALSLLSGIKINNLIEAVKNDDITLLIKIPGIGKSKAEKLIFELKRKLKRLEDFSDGTSHEPSIRKDSVEALISLGFEEMKSSKIIEDILKENPDSTIEFVIKEALKNLSA